MNDKKIEILTELLGEDISDLVAQELRSAIIDLEAHKKDIIDRKDFVAIWSHDDSKEIRKVTKMIKAMRTTYKWYSTGKLDV